MNLEIMKLIIIKLLLILYFYLFNVKIIIIQFLKWDKLD